MNCYAVIICGGKGERFWPKSRFNLPKQFVTLFGNRSLLRATSERIKKLCPLDRQFFVAPERFAPLIKKEVGIKSRNLLLEPVGKNTAPAIGLAAAFLSRYDPAGIMIVLPADHLISPREKFLNALRRAVKVAGKGYLVTFGITPGRPDTGYGYIHFGPPITRERGVGAYRVLAFKEKPDIKTAERYFKSGEYLWNSGMFVWRIDRILDAFREFLPDFYRQLMVLRENSAGWRQKAIISRIYRNARSISIDYAIMEKADNVAVIKADFDWDDVGSWLALQRHFPQDEKGNVVSGLWFQRESENCVVYDDTGVVVTLGIKDLVIVRSGDAVLVAHREALDGLKHILGEMAKDRRGKRFL